METQFQVEFPRLAVSAEDKLLRWSSHVQISLRKSAALLNSWVTEELDVGTSGKNSLSASGNKTKKPRKVSGSKIAKKSTEALSKVFDNIDFDLV